LTANGEPALSGTVPADTGQQDAVATPALAGLAQAVRRAERAERELAQARAALAPAQFRLDQMAEELRATRESLAGARADKDYLARALAALEGSTWWRLGAPLRRVANRFPAVLRPLRRGFRLAYWLMTGQVGARLRARRASVPPAAAIDLREALGLPPLRQPPAARTIALPDYGEPPVVSVIVASYGHVPYTLRCLASIAGAPPDTPTEVIVVDDASGDPRVSELADVGGLQLVRRATNLGFLKSCNDAARLARGDYLLLLNNDTEVMQGAIDAMVQTLRARPDAGLVGARLLYPDGWQQEAGGIVWRDGSAWNYGHRDDPRRPEYCYVRETDYLSGAAIMLPRAVWQLLGGFDEIFSPAYYEDTDLAFRVRQAGLKVLYQPDAKVVHFEGISNGTDLASGVKAYQKINQVTFLERWRQTLAGHPPNGMRVMRARDRAVGRTVTLVVDHFVPEPNRDAGSRAIMAAIDALLASGRVVKFFPVNLHRSPGYSEALQQRGVEVLHGPYTPRFAQWIADVGEEIDEVLISRPDVAEEVIGPLRAHSRARLIYYGHDLHHARLRGDPATGKDPVRRAAADAMEARERRIWSAVDLVLYLSE
jgi:GT2 family glycosyltransferase